MLGILKAIHAITHRYGRVVAAALLAQVLFVALGGATQVATVQVDALNVRSGPGKRYRVIFQLVENTQVRVVEKKGDWLKIDQNGRTGYIIDRPKYITLTSIDEQAGPSGGSKGVISRVPASDRIKDLNEEAETVQKKLEKSESELHIVVQKERSLLNEVNAAEQALDRARRQVRQARTALKAIEEKVAEIEQHYGELEKEIETGQAYASQRLVALYKLNWIGRIQLLATAGSFFDFIRRKSALEHILSEDEAVLEKLRHDQAALESLLEELNTSKAEKRASQIALNRRIETLAAEQRRRTELLKTIRSEKELKRAALQALKQAARELDSTIENLEQARTAPEDQTYAFQDLKGLLSWPVKGRIVSFYGPYRDEKTDVINFQSGINIKAERGEPIRAVSDGHTIFANWFKGFGNMLIIDHGNHYYTVYAHLEEVFKVKGDRVEKNEVIATVGDSGSLSGPGLHFEIRHHGKPVDPLDWINRG